jgi:predicted SAM-dependent methyltransferase
MTRKQKILRNINPIGMGIEIGPSYNPIAAKKDGYRVHIIDHMSKENLIKKYENFDVDVSNIEEVDFIWNGQKYSELTEKVKFYDWIIASHVIEHTPDLITFLNDCDEILKDDGVLSLAIPDRRYCFDHYRPPTGISQIIDGYCQQNKLHTPGTIAEYYLNIVSRNGAIAWDRNRQGSDKFLHSLDDVREKINSAVHRSEYTDAHAWCFTPNSFRLIINDLFILGYIQFREVYFFETEGCEFFITLGRQGNGLTFNRMSLLKFVEAENY